MGSLDVSMQNIKGLLRDAKIKEKQIKLNKRIYKSPVVESHGVTNPSIISKLRHKHHKQLSNICARTSRAATLVYDIMDTLTKTGGPGSSVGTAIGYGLDGPGSTTGGDDIFRPSRPALGSTQPPVQWVPGLSRG